MIVGYFNTLNDIFQDVCTAIAVGLHYIFLTAFFLMLAEGCWITNMVVTPLHVKNISPLLIALAFGLFHSTFFIRKYQILSFA